MQKLVYNFKEWDASLKNLLWWKWANLSEMTKLWLPVPPGFTLTTQVCNNYLNNELKFPKWLWEDCLFEIKEIEKNLWKEFGSNENPLLVSVRSWAPVSMPWMMDTILNLWLNDKAVEWLSKKTWNPRFAYDSYRRFIQMFSNVVLEINHWKFEEILENLKEKKGAKEDTDLNENDLKELIIFYKNLVKKETWEDFPSNPLKQLELSIKAVFNSWQNKRAIKYRKINKISASMWTAVSVQSMVYWNMWNTSWTWVVFTRNPSTWEKKLFWEFLMNAQWEDVVAWIRTPEDISKLEEINSKVFKEFTDICDKLENHFKDMQDIEFTVEEWRLFLLQTRNWKRSAKAWMKLAIDMEKEWFISKKEAVLRIDTSTIDQLLHPMIDENAEKNIVAKWLPASPGSACWIICFTAERAEELSNEWKDVILVRHETSPEDITWMYVSKWILTACGWMTSHAAVVARWMWTPCVSWAVDILVNEKAKKFSVWDFSFKEWDFLTLDWNTWEVIKWKCKMINPEISWDFEKILEWADEYKYLKVRTNADTPKDAQRARDFWAEWIWLCRTEHMFFTDEKLFAMREMILSSSLSQREKALAKLLPFQREDFKGILKAMEWFPVTIRLLDPPLHEFLPTKNSDIEKLSEEMWISFEKLKDKVVSLHETNPMLWHRGCRLMMTFPEIAKMQAKAVAQASCELIKSWVNAIAEIMIPLVWLEAEIKTLREVVEDEMREIYLKNWLPFNVKIWTMIELPRACLTAKRIAKHADFFSFWTNDLTQMTFWYSRDDVWKFLPEYIEKKAIWFDPFQTLDKTWVWTLIQIAVKEWRISKPWIKIWICWEHWWDPDSIDFFFHNDLNYVSCSPFRIPVARISAAQSFLKKFA